MKRASDFRAMARNGLAGRWLPAVGTTLLAGFLGAEINMYGSRDIFSTAAGNRGGYTVDTGVDGFDATIRNMMTISSGFWIVAVSLLVTSFLLLLLLSLVRYFIGGFVSLGLAKYNLNLIDGKEARLGQLFSYGFIAGKAVWLRIRMGVFTFLWSLLLIVPGIIKAYSYSMSGLIMAENPEISAREAMEVSMEMMRGNKWRLFCLELSFLGWGILSLFTLGIGFLWLEPYVNAAIAAFYDEVSRTV